MIFFFDFLVLSGAFGKQSLRFREDITFFFGITFFWTRAKIQSIIWWTGFFFLLSWTQVSDFFSRAPVLERRKRGSRGQEGIQCRCYERQKLNFEEIGSSGTLGWEFFSSGDWGLTHTRFEVGFFTDWHWPQSDCVEWTPELFEINR